MSTDYDGEVVLEINGKEVEVVSFDYTVKTGRKPVKTMNSKGRPLGSVTGSKTVEWKVTAPVQVTGEYDWEKMLDAQIVTYPFGHPSKRTKFIDSNVMEVGSKYQLDGELVRDITGYSLRKD